MASGRGAAGQEIKQHFATKEGCYRLLDLSVYSRPTKIPYSAQQCHPVRVSFVTVKDQGGCNERIAFNVGRELYFYIYKGVRKVSEMLEHHEKCSRNKNNVMSVNVRIFVSCNFRCSCFPRVCMHWQVSFCCVLNLEVIVVAVILSSAPEGL